MIQQFVLRIKGKDKRIVGPFETRAQASMWAITNIEGESWRIVELMQS